MIFEPTGIEGLWRIGIERHIDDRGSFGRLFCRDEFTAHGLCADFVQMNSSRTVRAGTVRGMHFQRPPHTEVKLVRCIRGTIQDIVCDVRPDSASYLKKQSFVLDAYDDWLLYIPAGCAHGFQTLTDDVEVFYAMSHIYSPGSGTGIQFDDPVLNIVWPLPVTCISEQDRAWPPYRPMAFSTL
ncbi:MAG: dTDP-4-dehydrorhamnose 3,5-epimerase family protein [Acetobacter sp.]|uniref:dTDP-4-dehydrorhamnose 3,5-epimerase family protein n=1 Tax=Acetobacter sp. TaxID=440 RepID=UPI0039E8DB60